MTNLASLIKNISGKSLQITKVILLTNVILRSTVSAQETSESKFDFPVVEDRYFGENPPGLIPKLFAPEILSPEGSFEGGGFSPNMTEYYFTRKNGKYKQRTFFVIRYANNKWGEESETDIHYPMHSRDGSIIYRGNKYRERTDTGWSELKSMGAPFTDKHIMGISVSDKGTFFFDEFERPDTVGAISYSRLIDGEYEPRQKMGKEINTGTWIAHPHIAPDESYLIWDVERDDGYGGSDIYISFRTNDGSWLPAMNMGDKINTEHEESGVSITPDGKYLFFSRGEWKVIEDGSTYWVGKPYWVDAQVIEHLRPSEFNFPLLEGPYLGQKPPGSTPEPFAPGIVSTANKDHSGFFAPDMKEFYFTRYDLKNGKWSLVVFKSENNRWRGSVVGPRVGRPIFAPDGKIMHMGSKYMERTRDGWSEVKNLGPMFDREDWGIMRLSSSLKGTYVFDDYKSNDVIRISQLKDGKREEPRLLGKEINTGKWTAHPFIAPDGSYILWDSERDTGYGDSDLYISYQQADETWSEAINLGDKINTEAWESGAYVTPDGKFLFFNRAVGSENVDIYWVDAQIIETLRPQ